MMFYHNQNNKRTVCVSLITICYVDIRKAAASCHVMFIYSIQKPNQCLLLFQSFIASKTILQMIKLFSCNITITTWNQSIFKLGNQSILKSICTLKYILSLSYFCLLNGCYLVCKCACLFSELTPLFWSMQMPRISFKNKVLRYIEGKCRG